MGLLVNLTGEVAAAKLVEEQTVAKFLVELLCNTTVGKRMDAAREGGADVSVGVLVFPAGLPTWTMSPRPTASRTLQRKIRTLE